MNGWVTCFPEVVDYTRTALESNMRGTSFVTIVHTRIIKVIYMGSQFCYTHESSYNTRGSSYNTQVSTFYFLCNLNSIVGQAEEASAAFVGC